jgi:patatin-like phospholipase/acyl hydrolase
MTYIKSTLNGQIKKVKNVGLDSTLREVSRVMLCPKMYNYGQNPTALKLTHGQPPHLH